LIPLREENYLDYFYHFPKRKKEEGSDLSNVKKLRFKTYRHIRHRKVDHVFSFSATGSADENTKLGEFIVIDQFARRHYESVVKPFRFQNPHPAPEYAIDQAWVPLLQKKIRNLGYSARNGAYLMDNSTEAFETALEMALIREDFNKNNIKDKLTKKYIRKDGCQVGMTLYNEAVLASQLGIAYNGIGLPVNWGTGMDPSSFGGSLTDYLADEIKMERGSLKKVNHKTTEKVMKGYKPLVTPVAKYLVKTYRAI